jgi:hypothetical protein
MIVYNEEENSCQGPAFSYRESWDMGQESGFLVFIRHLTSVIRQD